MTDKQTVAVPGAEPDRGVIHRLTEACRGPNALRAFFGVSILESSFVPIPIDLAMVPLGIAQPRNLPLIVLIGAVGSTIGAIIGYLIGAFFMATLGQWMIGLYGSSDDIESFRALYEAEGWRAVVVAGITPLPFTVATVLSGASGMAFHVFLAASFGVRLVRFALMGLMIRIFGVGIYRIMKKHTRGFTIVAIIATVLGFLALPWLT